METTTLGTTGLVVSRVGFGTARFAESFYDSTRQGMVELLRSAYDRGITFFDTSDMYAQGRSESLLGRAFGSGPSDVVISSKVGYVVTTREKAIARAKATAVPVLKRLGVPRPIHEPSSGPDVQLPQDFSPKAIRTGLEGSLRRLKRQHLDLYLLHGMPDNGGADDAFATLVELKQAGKVRHFGASCETLDDATRALATPGVEVVQLTLNLLDVDTLDHLRRANEHSVGTVVRQCFASGTLARPAAPPQAAGSPVGALREIATTHGRTLAELAFRYVADSPLVDVTLVGMRLPAHLEDTIRLTARPPLSTVEQDELAAIGVPSR